MAGAQHALSLCQKRKKHRAPCGRQNILRTLFLSPRPGAPVFFPWGPGATRAFARSPPAIIPAPSGRFGDADEQTPRVTINRPTQPRTGRQTNRQGWSVRSARGTPDKKRKKSIEPLAGDRTLPRPFCHPVPGLLYSFPRGPGATRAFARSPPAMIPAPPGRFGRYVRTPHRLIQAPQPRQGRQTNRQGWSVRSARAAPAHHKKSIEPLAGDRILPRFLL